MYQVFNTVKGDFPAKNVGADGEKDTVQKAHTNCHKLMNYYKEIKNCCLMRRWRPRLLSTVLGNNLQVINPSHLIKKQLYLWLWFNFSMKGKKFRFPY